MATAGYQLRLAFDSGLPAYHCLALTGPGRKTIASSASQVRKARFTPTLFEADAKAISEVTRSLRAVAASVLAGGAAAAAD